jgi:AraC-like DNA-binding protein
MPAGRRHCFTLTAGAAVSRWSHVQFHVFSSLDLMALIAPPTHFTGAASASIGARNSELAACQNDPAPGLHTIARRLAAAYGLLETIIGACDEPARGLHTLREAERLAPALAVMEERLGDPDLSLADLARAAGLSPSRFHAVFKQVLGLAPARHLQRRRMARAEALLIGSTLRIRDLGELRLVRRIPFQPPVQTPAWDEPAGVPGTGAPGLSSAADRVCGGPGRIGSRRPRPPAGFPAGTRVRSGRIRFGAVFS